MVSTDSVESQQVKTVFNTSTELTVAGHEWLRHHQDANKHMRSLNCMGLKEVVLMNPGYSVKVDFLDYTVF